MTKATTISNKTVAQAIIGRAKNGPRLVVYTYTAEGKRELRDVPAAGVNAQKIERAYPRQIIGVYSSSCKVEWLEADINAALKIK